MRGQVHQRAFHSSKARAEPADKVTSNDQATLLAVSDGRWQGEYGLGWLHRRRQQRSLSPSCILSSSFRRHRVDGKRDCLSKAVCIALPKGSMFLTSSVGVPLPHGLPGSMAMTDDCSKNRKRKRLPGVQVMAEDSKW